MQCTSEYVPPLPSNSLISAARLSPEFSSSILDIQSSFPVQINTCSAYGAIVPLRGLERSISNPSGSSGTGKQEHVGEGQVCVIGNWAGDVRVEAARERDRTWLDIRRGRRSGRRNMERVVVELFSWRSSEEMLLSYLICADSGPWLP